MSQEEVILNRGKEYPKDYSWCTDKVLQDYVRHICLKEHPVMKKCRLDTIKLKKGKMISSPVTQQLFKVLLPAIGAKKTLEIGVFTGYGALSAALSLPKDGKVVAIEYEEEIAKVSKEYFEKAGVAGKIDVKIGKANDHLDSLIKDGQSGTFDFAFIDADKLNYMDYYEKCLKLIRKNGIIALDNVLWDGSVCYDDKKIFKKGERRWNDAQLIKKLNEFISKDERVESVMLCISDGVSIVRKK